MAEIKQSDRDRVWFWLSLTHQVRVSSTTPFESKHLLCTLEGSFNEKTRVMVHKARVKSKDRNVSPPVIMDISEKLVVSREYLKEVQPKLQGF